MGDIKHNSRQKLGGALNGCCGIGDLSFDLSESLYKHTMLLFVLTSVEALLGFSLSHATEAPRSVGQNKHPTLTRG